MINRCNCGYYDLNANFCKDCGKCDLCCWCELDVQIKQTSDEIERYRSYRPEEVEEEEEAA